MASRRGGGGEREGSVKSRVGDGISQAVQSTSNLLRLMQETSPTHARLMKLPKNLLTKASTIRNTGQVLEKMPLVISSLDANLDNGLQSVHHLQTVIQLLEKIESIHTNSIPPNLIKAERTQNLTD
ncbi:tobamovirus multiplication protein 2B [Amborella trichopoda]|uniref:tobamovirus multiplication protein 2B n=1 Tax=Amborella trichopoda TaxID=13333 RepID=UPI0005D3EAA2|nr:tobamovirus multiplication protein 2B [Amborella trichopoda]|eukprot:XP_011624559.1 tobamovirus multiplication protein 2B [Amborella trichopoda]